MMVSNDNAYKREQMSNVNIGISERWASLVGGALLSTLAFRRRGLPGAVMGLMAGYLTQRGLIGHCAAYQVMGINTAVNADGSAVSVPHQQGIHVVKSVVINRPAHELYSYWRNFENLPHIMKHLKSVEVMDGNRSHWVAKGPAGLSVEWDAEIVNEVENDVIGWRSLKDAHVANAGSVQFKSLPGDNMTEVKVTLEYVPPAGVLGAAVAKLLGEEPEIQIEEDLQRFKQLMETGSPTTGSETSSRRRRSPGTGTSNSNYEKNADQAEGERNGGTSSKVGTTPGQAEG
jgi:uncharacterized membrane protein